MIIDYPIIELIERFLNQYEKAIESIDNNELKSFINSFYNELFQVVGNLSNKGDLLALLEYLTSVHDKVQLSLSRGISKEEQALLMELYKELHLRVRNELIKKGVFF